MDRAGLEALFNDPLIGPARLVDRLRGRGRDPRARAEGVAVGAAVARWPRSPDPATLALRLGVTPRYLSVGHAGLDARCLGAMAALDGSRCGVFVHDTIPLDLPWTQKQGASERFREKLAWVSWAADLVLAPLHATAGDIHRHLSALGWAGDIAVAPPGVTPLVPGDLPPGIPTDRPFFVALGTIEPRKNHAFLLDLWESLPPGPERPRLVIVGRRGWRNEAVFRRLDAIPAGGDVIMINDLDDSATAALLKQARALLFPSLAEGFGFPPLEAVSLGTPVVASPLRQVREVLGDTIIYADPNGRYLWQKAIGDLVTARPRILAPELPTWRDHFNTVLSSLG